PGSDATRCATPTADVSRTAKATLYELMTVMFLFRGFVVSWLCFCFVVSCFRGSVSFRAFVFSWLLIGRHADVVDLRAELRVDESARRSLPVSNRIDLVDRPGGRLRLASGPRLSAHAHRSVRLIFDPQLQVIPGVRLPRERLR